MLSYTHVSRSKFRHDFLANITKIALSRCKILQLQCTKFSFPFGWPIGVAPSAPNLLAGFEGKGEGKGKGRDMREKGEKEGKGKRKGRNMTGS